MNLLETALTYLSHEDRNVRTLAMYVSHFEGGKMRQFETGATRDSEEGKYDYEGFLSPLVIERFGAYMNKHRVQADGGLRASDNWQKGIPREAYVKSLFRHFFATWAWHRRTIEIPFAMIAASSTEAQEENLCAMLFNVQGYLHEILKAKAHYELRM